MRLSSINIRNFRNLRSVDLRFEHDITVIIGTNNSGKSNLLDAVYAGLRVNRTVRQGAFNLEDYYLADATAMAGDAGPIEIQCNFVETVPDDWNSDIVAAFGDADQLDVIKNLNSLHLGVKSELAKRGAEEKYEWNFLNAVGSSLPRKNFNALTKLQTIRPLYTLSAIRDATREFARRSTFFAPFLNDPQFEEAVRDELIESLSGINDTVVGAHEAFRTLEDRLNDGNRLVAGASTTVSIEAVPSRLSELLANTQVSFENPSGATIPLSRHGSGSQSLAVFSLFRAFVDTKIKGLFDPLTRPLLTIEEPESHLHPTATRSLWKLISSIDAQVIMTSHSGDLAGEVPLRCIRRVKHASGNTTVFCPDEQAFDPRDLRNLNYSVRLTRGELLLANVWLICEGKSDAAFLSDVALHCEIDLLAAGVRIVECAQNGGPAPLIRLAEQLGINWFCFFDGDDAGNNYSATTRGLLGLIPATDRLLQLDSKTLEAFFAANGFLHIYEAHASPQKRAKITETSGTKKYAEAIGCAVVRRDKEIAAMEVAAEIGKDVSIMPAVLLEMFKKCLALS